MRKHVTLKFKSGKSTKRKIELRDNGYMGQSGIYINLDTNAKVEALINGLTPLVEGVCYSYIMPTSIYRDDIVAQNPQGDTNGLSGFVTVSVYFTDSNLACRITIKNAKTSKDDEFKALFASQEYFDFNGTKLTMKGQPYINGSI
ncbi:MAG: hypothetical protein NTX05_06040 [Fusobacteria bacterium]|nr:hypothetical protein [Fusobacteriota bacterium]